MGKNNSKRNSGNGEKIVSFVVDSEGEEFPKGIAFSLDPQSAFIFFFPQYPRKIKEFLEDKNIGKIGFDLKREWRILDRTGIKLEAMAFDTQLAAYLLKSGSNLSWEDLGDAGAWVMIAEKKEKAGDKPRLIFQEDEKEIEKMCREPLKFRVQRKTSGRGWKRSAGSNFPRRKNQLSKMFLKNWRCP